MPITATESGDYLKRLRIEAGLTQEQLAEKCSAGQPTTYGQSWISHVERGREVATLDYGWRVADVLDLGLRKRHELLTLIAQDRGEHLGAYLASQVDDRSYLSRRSA